MLHCLNKIEYKVNLKWEAFIKLSQGILNEKVMAREGRSGGMISDGWMIEI